VIVVLASDITYNIEPFAKKLAVSLGAVYRQLEDDFLLKNTGFFEEPKQGKIVFVGHTIASKLVVPSIKIFLRESDENIFNRISLENKVSLEEAKEYRQTKLKEEKERLTKLYGIDLLNQDVYDLILRIDNLDLKSIINVIEKYIAKVTKD